MCERDIPSPEWRKGWAVRAAHKKRTSSITRTHSLQKGKQRETKCQETSVSELTKKEGQETSVSELTKRKVQLLVRTSVALLTKLVSSFQPGYWCLILHTHHERHSRVPVSTKGKLTWPLPRWRQKYPRKVPMPYKSNIRVMPLLVEEGVSTILFLLFCVNIFCFLFSFWYAQTRAPFFYCLFAFVLIFYCFFCF